MAQVFGSLIGGVAQLVGDFRAIMYLAAIVTIVGFVLFSVNNKRHQVD